jgi:acyl transferase domain-containing protein
MMEPVLDTFTALVRQMELNSPRIPFISNLTGSWIQPSEATDPSYWARHLRNTVRFSDGLQEILREPSRVLLEVGPGQTLGTFAKQAFGRTSGLEVYASLPHASDKSADDAFLHTTLGRLWLSGVKVDWAGVHASERLRRVGLPTYPFERKRYWPEPKQVGQVVTAKKPHAGKKPDIADWFYVPVWRETPSILNPLPANLLNKPENYLVFQDEDGIGAELTQRLRKLNQKAIAITTGEVFGKTAPFTYSLNPSKREHYWRLFDELAKSDLLPDRIVHFWTVSALKRPIDRSVLRHSLDVGFYSLLYTTQALGERQFTDPVEIVAVTMCTHSIGAEEVLSPESATLLGLSKVIPQEYPNFRTRNIDFAYQRSDDGSDPRRITDLVMKEMTSVGGFPVVAYRGNRRWIQEYESLRVENNATPLRLRSGGVYLITGGLGGIAFHLANWLAKKVGAKLVLMGRSALPARDAWDDWLSNHDVNDSVSLRIKRIRTLEEAGAEVLVITADVVDQEQLHAAIKQTCDRFGCINGVFHAAGIVDGASMQETNLEFCERTFHAKVYGLVSLAEVIKNQELDFCMLVSSLSSVLGGLGFAAYSAANIFMDAFALQQNQCSNFPWISVNWDAWDLTEAGPSAVQGTLPFAMSCEEGIEVFERLLSSDLPCQVVISTSDLARRLRDWIYLDPPSKESKGNLHSAPEPSAAQLRQQHETADAQFQDDYERTTVSIWQELLGISSVGPEDNFFELGGHSLLATRILARIQEAFKVRLPLRMFFESPTVAGLAKQIQTIVWVQKGAQVAAVDTLDEREEIEL